MSGKNEFPGMRGYLYNIKQNTGYFVGRDIQYSKNLIPAV